MLHAGTWSCPGTRAELQTYGTLAAFVGDELRGKSDAPTSATMGPLRGHGTALYKFEVWANPVTETVEFKFCDAHGRKVELEGRGMEGETHHMGYPPADAIPCNTTADCPTSGACTSHPVCLAHANHNSTRYCVEQVVQGEFGTSWDACADGWPSPPYVSCHAGIEAEGDDDEDTQCDLGAVAPVQPLPRP